eukprot:scaffold122_cov88-Skeletonema_marinoi.AAC.2
MQWNGSGGGSGGGGRGGHSMQWNGSGGELSGGGGGRGHPIHWNGGGGELSGGGGGRGGLPIQWNALGGGGRGHPMQWNALSRGGSGGGRGRDPIQWNGGGGGGGRGHPMQSPPSSKRRHQVHQHSVPPPPEKASSQPGSLLSNLHEPEVTLHVTNVSYEEDEKSLRELFERHGKGEVTYCKTLNGGHKSWVVKMYYSSANRACEAINGKIDGLSGEKIVVQNPVPLTAQTVSSQTVSSSDQTTGSLSTANSGDVSIASGVSTPASGAEFLFGKDNFTTTASHGQNCSDRCDHDSFTSSEPDSLAVVAHAKAGTDEGSRSRNYNSEQSAKDALAVARFKAEWDNRTRHLPTRTRAPVHDWDVKFGISFELLTEQRAATLKKLEPLRKDCPDLVDYFSELVRILYPGDLFFLVLLHCALQWFRGHICAQLGGGSALGDDIDLGALGNRSLDGMSGLSQCFERFSSIKMGSVGEGILAVLGRQGNCPTETRDFAPCPALREDETTPEIVVKACSILLNHCDKVKSNAYMFSAAGSTTKVNKRILHKLADSFDDSDHITVDRNELNHIQFLQRGFWNSTLVETYKAMSSKLQKVSECLASHLVEKCCVDLDQDDTLSLFEFACGSTQLPMIGKDPKVSEESLQKLVKSSRVDNLGVIVSHCRVDTNSLARDGPPEVKGYAAFHFEDINAREIEYKEEERRDCVPANVDERKGKRKWLPCTMRVVRVRVNHGQESDDDDASDDLSGQRFTRLKKRRCEEQGCAKYAQQGGKCHTHGAKRKRCEEQGCAKYAQQGGKCHTHGAKRKRCEEQGCTNYVQEGGKCVTHGATKKRKLCEEQGCANYVQQGGKCHTHGAKRKRCEEQGCTNYVQQGGKCHTHGAKMKTKRCEEQGCTNYVQEGGKCVTHGAKKRRCEEQGCTQQAQQGGKCVTHGAVRYSRS